MSNPDQALPAQPSAQEEKITLTWLQRASDNWIVPGLGLNLVAMLNDMRARLAEPAEDGLTGTEFEGCAGKPRAGTVPEKRPAPSPQLRDQSQFSADSAADPAIPLSTIERVLWMLWDKPDDVRSVPSSLSDVYTDGWNAAIEASKRVLSAAAITPETPQ